MAVAMQRLLTTRVCILTGAYPFVLLLDRQEGNAPKVALPSNLLWDKDLMVSDRKLADYFPLDTTYIFLTNGFQTVKMQFDTFPQKI